MKFNSYLRIIVCLFVSSTLMAQEVEKELTADPIALFNLGRDKIQAEQIIGPIYWAEGFSNTFMITSPKGNIIIDTSMPFNGKMHKELLQKVDDGPIKYIILTHGHPDHRGNVDTWKEEGTKVIAHENYVELRHYQERLAPFLRRRGNAQFNRKAPIPKSKGNFGAAIEATQFVKDSMSIKLGGLTLHLHHAPGETPDQLAIWVPKYKAAFIGDNFYRSFPNMYTLRGTKPRWALDYVQSIDKVLTWKPEVLIPSHGDPIQGWEAIKEALEKYKAAILYVHDKTVEGMNAGKTANQLMREIRLPQHLDVGDAYGKVAWSVRGIYEGYAGWYDGQPKHMYFLPESAIYSDLVDLAGGTEKIAAKARDFLAKERPLSALHMADVGLAKDPQHIPCLEVKLAAYKILLQRSDNANEKGWLTYGIQKIESFLIGLED